MSVAYMDLSIKYDTLELYYGYSTEMLDMKLGDPDTHDEVIKAIKSQIYNQI